MPYPVDPASLEGDELEHWYRRSPQEIEAERQAAESQRYRDFFGTDSGGMDDDASPSASFGQQDDPGGEFGSVASPAFSSTSPSPSASTSADSLDRSSLSHPGPMPPPPFGSSGAWPHPVPMPAPWDILQPSGWRPVPLGRSLGTGPAMIAASAGINPTSTGRSGAPQSSRPTASPAQGGNALHPGRQTPIDPSKVNVFQTGPDGKLHPIPGWHTTGPFDFSTWSHDVNWGGVAKDLTNIGLGAADVLGVGELGSAIVDGLGYKIGPAVVRGIVEGHHAMPKFMGGAADQRLAPLFQSLHRMFHGDLGGALSEAGFPRIGGRGGSAEDWANFFKDNPAKRDEAMAILRKVTRDFDRKNGTTISKYLDGAMGSSEGPAPPPPQ